MYLLLVLTFFLISCETFKNDLAQQDFLISEKDIIPEGVAFDNRTKTVFISSTYKRKILMVDQNGLVSDFISSQNDSLTSVIGMEVDEDRDLLWVNIAHANMVLPLINPDTTKNWQTGVLAFDISEKRLVNKIFLNNNNKPAFFNDLTVLPNGDVYITETFNNEIYILKKEKNALELFFKTDSFSFLNGITSDQLAENIYVSSSEGIIKIKIYDKSCTLLSSPDSINAKVIDGLAFKDNYLIGHQSTKVTKFYINKNFSKIESAELLNTGKEFDSTTTGEIGDEFYYFIVNSQLKSAFDENKEIKVLDSLENVIVRKIKL